MSLIGSLTLVEIECANCITHFAMDEALQRRCRETGRDFYCPNGHINVYRDNELARLRKEREQLKHEADNARKRMTWAERLAETAAQERDQVKKAHAATKGQLTKTRKRIANGVCPCCHRTFKQLASHMAHKHPGFENELA
jgi:DNA repair exonuclease SbcCD ATPase subunit